MQKTIFDIMDASDDCLDEFRSVCTELAQAKYILAEKKMSVVLQTIAKNKKLYAFFADCMEGFDFSYELAKARKTDGAGNPILILPTERKERIAFVFCLLLSFDTGATEFKEFLHTFYESGVSANAEYAEFAADVIAPFCEDVVNGLLHGTQLTADKAQRECGSADAPRPMYSERSAPQRAPEPPESTPKDESPGISPALVEPLLACAKEIIGIAARDPGLGAQEREELLLMCEAFVQAVRFNAEKPARTMYIGLKNTMRCCSIAHRLETQARGLERMMD